MSKANSKLKQTEIQRSAENRGKNRVSPIAKRSDIPKAKRVVVKVGSSSLTSIANSLDELAVATVTDVLAKAHARNVEVVFVSSGAIAAGLAPLGLSRRPKDLSTQQAAASVGQSLIMTSCTSMTALVKILLSATTSSKHARRKSATACPRHTSRTVPKCWPTSFARSVRLHSTKARPSKNAWQRLAASGSGR